MVDILYCVWILLIIIIINKIILILNDNNESVYNKSKINRKLGPFKIEYEYSNLKLNNKKIFSNVEHLMTKITFIISIKRK